MTCDSDSILDNPTHSNLSLRLQPCGRDPHNVQVAARSEVSKPLLLLFRNTRAVIRVGTVAYKGEAVECM